MKEAYRFRFTQDVPVEEVEGSVLLALFAVESLHGAEQTRLDAEHTFDSVRRVCTIDTSTAVGRDLARIFSGFIRREFGQEAFAVERVEFITHPATEVPA